MRKTLKKKDTLALRGFIEIEKINTKNHTREVYRNTITNAGKQFLLDKSASLMLGMAADVFGMTACSNTLTRLSVASGTAVAGRNARSDRDITNVLLNLDENVMTGLGASTTFINVFDDELESASHVIGYANNNVVPTGDNKEGNIDFSKGEYLVDPYTICKRWKYAEGIATGTINCVAMMPASCIKQNNGDGIKFSKCIDQINTQYTNYLSMSTGFLIPGIPGYTANNEILLNFNKDSNARWKYNIGTGEITSVPITDNFFIPTAADRYSDIVDMQYIDNYLYVLSLYVGSNSPTIHVDVYDPANAMNKVANFNCNTKSGNEYEIKASIFKVGSTLYVSAISDKTTTRDTVSKLWSLNKSGGDGYASSASAAQTDFSSIGLTIPSGLDIRFTGLGSYNGNYILYNLVQMYDDVSADKDTISSSYIGYKMTGIVFTDLSDPIGSAVDMIDGINPNEIMFSAGSTAGTLRVGFDKFNSAGTGFGYCYDLVDDKHIIMNNTSSTNIETVTVDTTKAGVYMSLDKWWTNVISFVKLSTPIVKAANDIIYVSYGYKIVV